MQRVVRLSLVALLATAGLTACGDKVNIVQPTTPPAATPVVHSVTVTPGSASVAVGGKATFVAAVDADAGITDRTVTWSSSDATVASVDANGVATGLKNGTTQIIAQSKADGSVKGAAALTVGGANNGPVTVSISSTNATVCGVSGCSSVPANLQNFGTAGTPATNGQLDVILNVDAGGQVLQSVTAVIKCGTDSLVQTQNISSSNVAVDASAASAPVTLSFNTAAFNSANGTPSLHNGACTISASAKTASGTQSASTSQTLNLNNADFIAVSSVTTAPSAGQIAVATDSKGLSWRAGAVTVTATPVMYSGKSIASASVNLLNGAIATGALGKAGAAVAAGGTVASASGLTPTAGVISASFANSTTAATGVGGAKVDTLTVSLNTIDSQGNNGPSFSIAAGNLTGNFIRLDNNAPDITTTPPSFNQNTQGTSTTWVGSKFVFGVASSGTTKPIIVSTTTTGDNGGVGGVTTTTLWKTVSSDTAAASYASFATPGDLPETSSATANSLRLKVCDALGNCVFSNEITKFGVDLTAPTVSLAATSIGTDSIYGFGSTPVGAIKTLPVDPQGANGATGSGFGGTPVSIVETRTTPKGAATGQSTLCVIGTLSNSVCTPADSAQDFTATTANSGDYNVAYFVRDQANNTSATSNLRFYVDQNAPELTGTITVPPTTVGVGSVFTTTATDSLDLSAANGYLHYPIAVATGLADARIVIPGTLSASGVPFDNVLVRSATNTVTIPANQFYRQLGSISGSTFTAGVKPNQISLRATDATGNLSVANTASIPPGTVTTGVDFSATDLLGFTVAANPTTVKNTGTTGTRSTTLTAEVAAPSLTANTPFTQVCFYAVTPSGAEGGVGNKVTATAANDLTLITCSTTVVTTQVGGNRFFDYTASFDPSDKYGAGTLNIIAIGSNANTDALATGVPVTLTMN